MSMFHVHVCKRGKKGERYVYIIETHAYLGSTIYTIYGPNSASNSRKQRTSSLSLDEEINCTRDTHSSK